MSEQLSFESSIPFLAPYIDFIERNQPRKHATISWSFDGMQHNSLRIVLSYFDFLKSVCAPHDVSVAVFFLVGPTRVSCCDCV
jgi:hypothetical protein